jgi:uncharacterized Fe-S cluster protein YjdI
MSNMKNIVETTYNHNHNQDKNYLKLILIDLNNILSWQNSSLIYCKITSKTFNQSSKNIDLLNSDLKSINFNTISDVENHLFKVKTYLVNFDFWLNQNLISIENFSKDVFFNGKYIDYTFNNLTKIKTRLNLNNVISMSKQNLSDYTEYIELLKITFVNQAMIEDYKTQFIVILYKGIASMNEARVIWYNAKVLVEKKPWIISDEANKLTNHYNISVWLAETIEKIAIENQTKAKESNLIIKLQTLILPDAIN